MLVFGIAIADETQQHQLFLLNYVRQYRSNNNLSPGGQATNLASLFFHSF